MPSKTWLRGCWGSVLFSVISYGSNFISLVYLPFKKLRFRETFASSFFWSDCCFWSKPSLDYSWLSSSSYSLDNMPGSDSSESTSSFITRFSGCAFTRALRQTTYWYSSGTYFLCCDMEPIWEDFFRFFSTFYWQTSILSSKSWWDCWAYLLAIIHWSSSVLTPNFL